MNKDQKKSRRVLARQVAVELPDEGLAQVTAGEKGSTTSGPIVSAFRTCDGTLTRDPRTGRDCTGQTDDIGFPEV